MKQKVTLILLATFLCCVLGVQAQTGSQVTGKVMLWENFPESASL